MVNTLAPSYGYEIEPRPSNLGGGWRLRLLEGGTEVEGGRFLRKELDLSQHRLPDLIGTTEQTVALWERHGKIPKTADRMIRAIYLEMIDGNVKLKEMHRPNRKKCWSNWWRLNRRQSRRLDNLMRW